MIVQFPLLSHRCIARSGVIRPSVVKPFWLTMGVLFTSRVQQYPIRDVDPINWHQHRLLGTCGHLWLPWRCAFVMGPAACITLEDLERLEQLRLIDLG